MKRADRERDSGKAEVNGEAKDRGEWRGIEGLKYYRTVRII